MKSYTTFNYLSMFFSTFLSCFTLHSGALALKVQMNTCFPLDRTLTVKSEPSPAPTPLSPAHLENNEYNFGSLRKPSHLNSFGQLGFTHHNVNFDHFGNLNLFSLIVRGCLKTL